MFKNRFWHQTLKLTRQQGPIINCFIICFVSAPFRSWPTDFRHVIISSIITVLLAHCRIEHIEMFGDLSLQYILHNTISMAGTPRVQVLVIIDSAFVIYISAISKTAESSSPFG